MQAGTTCGLSLLFAFLLGCSAFNLDPASVVRREGEPGSLFGFSMVMHRQLQPVDKAMLLVGAPKAKAWRGQKAKETGGLYSCDMSSPSCRRVNFDEGEDTRRESKENQWMGVSVSSQGPGGKVLTCAHRYQRRSNVNTAIESRDIIGRCYVLSQDLTINTGSSEDGGNWHFCESRPRGHEMFGSCQQGMSAMFDKDFHYLIFGAPGAYNWKGLVRLEQKNDTFIEMGIYDDGPFEAGDENEKNPDLVPAAPNSYLGFSLDSGKSLTKQGQLTVVAGAPRANHSGAVVLLKKGADTSKIMLHEFTLEGEGLASSFGYDLAVLDLNKDGWQDIVVGAPQYFEKDGEIGGAVYVYINKEGKWDQVKPTRIDGPMDSMFGLAVENLGDINQDGYQDFAVGAPYDDEGAGNVYIYHGSETGLSSTKASQILPGKPLSVKLFGYSLAGNMDLDQNTYPDLAVGSLSDAVFVFRARPVINIKKEIRISPEKIDLTQKNCGNTFCLDIEACLSYTANPSSYSPSLTVAYSLEVDSDFRKKGRTARATFTGGSESGPVSKGTVTIAGQGDEKCLRRQLAIQENIKDKLHGIPIDVLVKIMGDSRKRRQSGAAQLTPVLDAKDDTKTRSMVDFTKEGCGSDNVCKSKLQVAYRYGHWSARDETFTPLKLEGGVPLLSLSNQNDVTLEVKVTNPGGDDAYEASVLATFPSSLTYSTFRALPNQPTESQVTCVANKNGSQADCELGNPFKRDAETTFYIILGTSGISLSTNEVEVDLKPETTSEQQIKDSVKAKARVAILLELSLSGKAKPSQVYFTGDVKGEAAMKTQGDVGSAIMYQFTIINLGKRLTDTATLEVDWPKQTEQGKWLLYLTKIGSTGVEHLDCMPKSEINPLNLGESNSRRRRAAENTPDSDEGLISRLTDKKSKTLSCRDGADCVKIRCPLRGLDSNAVVTFESRLWNGTFIEDYSKLHHAVVEVGASLRLDSTNKNTLLQNADTKVSLTAFPERLEAQYGGVPWWIIVLSVLLGLLLLGLLAFLLWKCGLFGKKNKEDVSEKERLTSNA
ncbi:integrin alpha-6b isoform X2 [Nelusetta ayraudi]|uniref:integrin alpha-6b isoform X2 n=1 Tax=Nelusetta ayraudi TaxID=303726 RepID=UPI003F72EACE